LLPTPTNVDVMHVPRGDCEVIVAVQQWLQEHLGICSPLLQGCWVSVRTADLQQQQQQQRALAVGCSAGPPVPASNESSGPQHMQPAQASTGPDCESSSTAGAAAAAAAAAAADESAAIPWRLRQVKTVQVAPGVDPADATVELVGGESVLLRDLGAQPLLETADYEVCSRSALLHISVLGRGRGGSLLLSS
jgi:hypothetical protein